MKKAESSSVEDKKSYRAPKLIAQGHVSQVTKKTGTGGDNEGRTYTQAPGELEEAPDINEFFGEDSEAKSGGSSEETFDNFFDD